MMSAHLAAGSLASRGTSGGRGGSNLKRSAAPRGSSSMLGPLATETAAMWRHPDSTTPADQVRIVGDGRLCLPSHQDGFWRPPDCDLSIDPAPPVLPELARSCPAFDGGLALPRVAPAFGQIGGLPTAHQRITTAGTAGLEDPFLEAHIDPTRLPLQPAERAPRSHAWSNGWPCTAPPPMLNESTDTCARKLRRLPGHPMNLAGSATAPTGRQAGRRARTGSFDM